MGKTEQPVLSLQQAVGVESARKDIDQFYWGHLIGLQVTTPYAAYVRRHERVSRPSVPPPAKEPAKLLMFLVDYSKNYFIVEANLFQAGPNLRGWLESVRESTIEHVLEMVNKLEEEGERREVSLKHHGADPDEAQSLMREAINNLIDKRLNHPPPGYSPPPPPLEIRREMRAGVDRPSASPIPSSSSVAQEPVPDAPSNLSAKRKAVVEPLLGERGWSSLEWASHSSVSYHTAADYLAGKRSQYRSTRKKLAESLGLSVQQLPR
ncbi:MAG TPA: hypothetical protein VGG45_10530 [Terracidiphilus sp.]|jgi:hypothetical protein